MSKFIKLTRLKSDNQSYSCKPVYVSVDAIRTFYTYINYTVVDLGSEDGFIKVQEDPESILKMIDTANGSLSFR